jgi:hypothetical protein
MLRAWTVCVRKNMVMVPWIPGCFRKDLIDLLNLHQDIRKFIENYTGILKVKAVRRNRDLKILGYPF